MKAIISLFALVASVLAQSRDFEEFILTHNKVYKDSNELQARQKIFEDNKKIIDEHNQRYAKGLETFEMGVNKFTDLSSSELKKYKNNKIDRNDDYKSHVYHYTAENKTIPKSINWVDKGAVTPVKYQGKCGSCWAFGAVAALEGQYFRKTGKLISLSEQNLIDCSSTRYYQNDGCNGGFAYRALQYVIDNNGIQTRESYLYEGHQGICRYDEYEETIEINDFKIYENLEERSLMALVAEVGPIAVDLNSTYMKYYMRGVYNHPCQGNDSDHVATLVGYGYDSDGGDYWLIKNSWGKDWGENGYIRLARNKGNLCQIGNFSVVPII